MPFVMPSGSTSPSSSRTYSLQADGEADILDIPLTRSPRGMSLLNKILAGKYDFMAHQRKTSDHEQSGGNVFRPEMKRLVA